MTVTEPYQFSNQWFAQAAKPVWSRMIPRLKPRRILEIGSFEGASACFLIDTLASIQPIEIHCVDSWGGGIEHQPGGMVPADMTEVEVRFAENLRKAIAGARCAVDLQVHKGLSNRVLPGLIANGQASSFDFVYIDGSHQAADVLCDAVMGFQLLRVGGIMAFDDYLWHEKLPGGVDLLRCPKLAIDAFTNIFARKIRVVPAPLKQLYVKKTSE